MKSRPFDNIGEALFGKRPEGSDPLADLADKLYGKRSPWKPREKPRCSGVWDYGPFQGERCDETSPMQLVKCNTVLDPGCEKYFCLTFHWTGHWDEHGAG